MLRVLQIDWGSGVDLLLENISSVPEPLYWSFKMFFSNFFFRVLKKSLFVKELEPQWPGSDKYWDWDLWMRTPYIRKGECLTSNYIEFLSF